MSNESCNFCGTPDQQYPCKRCQCTPICQNHITIDMSESLPDYLHIPKIRSLYIYLDGEDFNNLEDISVNKNEIWYKKSMSEFLEFMTKK